MRKKVARRMTEAQAQEFVQEMSNDGNRCEIELFPNKWGDMWDIYQLDAEQDICSRCGEEKHSPYSSVAFPKLCKGCWESSNADLASPPVSNFRSSPPAYGDATGWMDRNSG